MSRRHSIPPLIAVLAAVWLAACAQVLTLPTVANDNGGCRDIGYDGVLRGDPNDPRVAWGEHETPVNHVVIRQDLIWPPGYTARFNPQLEILDASRNVRYVAGDILEGGCVTGPGSSGPLYLIEE